MGRLVEAGSDDVGAEVAGGGGVTRGDWSAGADW